MCSICVYYKKNIGKCFLDIIFNNFNKLSNRKIALAVDATNKFAVKAYLRNQFKKQISRKVINENLNMKKKSIFHEYLMIR